METPGPAWAGRAVWYCLTLAGLAVRSGEEAHVAFTAKASGHVQTVATLTQVAVLCTLVAVCNSDRKQAQSMST